MGREGEEENEEEGIDIDRMNSEFETWRGKVAVKERADGIGRIGCLRTGCVIVQCLLYPSCMFPPEGLIDRRTSACACVPYALQHCRCMWAPFRPPKAPMSATLILPHTNRKWREHIARNGEVNDDWNTHDCERIRCVPRQIR